MALPIIEVPSGAIDGVNVNFTTSQPYAPGNIHVFLNGLLQRRDFVDGWVETNPAAGIVTLKEAPQSTDVVQVYFLPAASTNCSEVAVTELRAVLNTQSEDLTGILQAATPVRVNLKCGCP